MDYGEKKEFDNNMSGVLFVNNYKTPNDNKPDMRGTCTINGQEFQVAAWRKTAKNGNPFLSLNFQLPWNPQQGATANNPLDFLPGQQPQAAPTTDLSYPTTTPATTDIDGFTVDPDDEPPF